MTAQGRFDRIQANLPELLDQVALPSTPDYVDDLLARTSATRQRPRWTFLERWFPMGVIARDRILVPPVPWRAVGLAATLLLLTAAALMIVGSQRKLPPPFGIAANGVLVQDGDGDIFIRDAPAAPRRLIVGGPQNDFAPGFTRDGTRLTFLRMEEDRPGSKPDVLAVMVAEPDGSNVRELIGGLEAPEWFDWSPDGRQLVVQQNIDNVPRLNMIDVPSGRIRPFVTEQPAYTPTWRGPDGREIIYRGWVPGESKVALFAISPDGTGNRPIAPPSSDLVGGYDHPQVSPDGRYVTYNGWDDQGRFRIHLLDVDTGRIEPLDFGPAVQHHGYASFSPDGSLLLFHGISENNRVQVMLAPLDRNGPAVPIGPEYPVLGGSARLQQGFSPDGRLVLISEGHDFEVRKIAVADAGLGEVMPWDTDSFPAWQRLPFDD